VNSKTKYCDANVFAGSEPPKKRTTHQPADACTARHIALSLEKASVPKEMLE